MRLIRLRSLAVTAALALPCGAQASPTPGEPGTDWIRFGDPDALAYAQPFFPGESYDPALPSPDALLGQPHGSRIAHHAEIAAAFRTWALVSPRVTYEPYARSHEGRELLRVVITSPENHARMADIEADMARLADPRGLSDAEAHELLARVPAVAWLGYSIHGDELSGADASMAFGYHLAAGQSAEVSHLLDELVVILDPVMNPDGRERILGMIEQSAGYVANLDGSSMHRGRWPWGRGNHYLFDMNRDWIAGIMPETRGRWRAVQQLPPQLFVDAHEMGGQDTYLFYPRADPINPHLPASLTRWSKVFGDEQGEAFDEQGWAYYTREWAEGWYPGYSDSWSALLGAVGVLYEQAGVAGQPLRRASGVVMTYRESVHHQAVSSLTNVQSLLTHKDEMLADFLAERRKNVSAGAPDAGRAFTLLPSGHPTREARFVELLLAQGVEVQRLERGFRSRNAVTSSGETLEEGPEVPEGAWLVPLSQPHAPIVRAFLEFDTRYGEETLLKERTDLERKGSSNIYDVTSWNLAQAFDLDALWCDAPNAPTSAVEAAPVAVGGVVAAPGEREPVAWIVDGRDDSALRFAVHAMAEGLAVHLGDEPFQTQGRAFSRWSLVVRVGENLPAPRPGPLAPEAEGTAARVERAAVAAGATVYASTSGRSPDEGPDLGGGHFTLLSAPSIAVVTNTPALPEEYGYLWHELDVELGLAFSLLDAQGLGWTDLRRFDVIVLPDGGFDGFLARHGEALKEWTEAGGTLIACGGAARAVVQSDAKLSSVVLRRDALEELDGYAFAAEREWGARDVQIDFDTLWDGEPAEDADDAEDADESEPGAGDGGDDEGPEGADPDSERQDAWERRFGPQGATLRAIVDDEHWITAGLDGEFPALVGGSAAYLSRSPVRAPLRLAEAEELRLAGLLWPEARARLARTAFLTTESLGSGQVILFTQPPAYRGFHRGSARLFGNAVLYGPGAGAYRPLPR